VTAGIFSRAGTTLVCMVFAIVPGESPTLSQSWLSHALASYRVVDLSVAALRDRSGAAITDLPVPVRPAFAAALGRRLDVPMLILTSRQDRAERLHTAISEYAPAERRPVLWPAPDALPYEQLPLDHDAHLRMQVILDRLVQEEGDAPLIVASITGLMQLVAPPAEIRERTLSLNVGQRIRIERLMEWALATGYRLDPLVQEPGSIAKRGGIVDIFPTGAEMPVRIDFFDEDIESIRWFNPHTQRSVERARSIRLLPPAAVPVWRLGEAAPAISRMTTSDLRPEVRDEWDHALSMIEVGNIPTSIDLYAGFIVPERSTLLEFLPATTAIVFDQRDQVGLSAGQMDAQAEELKRTFIESGEIPPDLPEPFVRAETALSHAERFPWIAMGDDLDQSNVHIFGGDLTIPTTFAGRMTPAIETARQRLAEGWRLSVATDQVDRLTDLFEEAGIYPHRAKTTDVTLDQIPPGTMVISASDLTAGWTWEEGKFELWTDLEIFGFRKQARRAGKRTVSEGRAFAQGLEKGEYVVHIDHGIAKFEGLVRMETHGTEREYLLLVYEKGDKLYVPVDQSDRVTRYNGAGLAPTLNRLGSGEWTATKRRARRAIREMAFELIQLYAHRESGVGHKFPADTRWDVELADSFPYVETRDQATAIDQVTQDMETQRAMDRLICGDVGFGKTEVAIRAAFKAVNGGKQVAILVPTTVLALQHYTTFTERLAAFPVRVEQLSRLRNPKEQRQILADLAAGAVDIVVGTHRLVQKDVRFKDLGLVIVDEEQRFGVRQKEFLKQLKRDTDVLTMSATPIPRTLHMSLSGIRDISMIETAPQARLPIRTFVTAFTDNLIREVILREMERGGQIYFVHNRVHDIDILLERLRKIVPEARFGVGHGQMDENVLEDVMLGFMRHDFDVLLCTTIIESGVDIPNVNTIIIDNADTLGLTQLYQLRGRVGRSANRAYAYLLYQPHKHLKLEAQERLETIQEATELGAGLRVAMRDLEIRGAGNILGAEQSGHIGAIGYDLYVRLLNQAVEEIRTGTPAVDQEPVTLDLPLTALIPADYIQDAELRLRTYSRIASATTHEDIVELSDELRDRFGDFPVEVEHLMALIELRIRSAALGIESVVEREREIVVRPIVTSALDHRRLSSRLGDAIRITPNSIRIRLLDLDMLWQDALNLVLDEIERVQGLLLSAVAD
jgi:transcription-repair coupling factor (superfamily II helicase)